MLAYSARNNKAKKPPPNSTLNPETNSDSPSAKSKGARLVSATVLVNQTNAIGTRRINTGKDLSTIPSQENLRREKAPKSRISNSLTS